MPVRVEAVHFTPDVIPANTRSLMTSSLKYITQPCIDVFGPTMEASIAAHERLHWLVQMKVGKAHNSTMGWPNGTAHANAHAIKKQMAA